MAKKGEYQPENVIYAPTTTDSLSQSEVILVDSETSQSVLPEDSSACDLHSRLPQKSRIDPSKPFAYIFTKSKGIKPISIKSITSTNPHYLARETFFPSEYASSVRSTKSTNEVQATNFFKLASTKSDQPAEVSLLYSQKKLSKEYCDEGGGQQPIVSKSRSEHQTALLKQNNGIAPLSLSARIKKLISTMKHIQQPKKTLSDGLSTKTLSPRILPTQYLLAKPKITWEKQFNAQYPQLARFLINEKPAYNKSKTPKHFQRSKTQATNSSTNQRDVFSFFIGSKTTNTITEQTASVSKGGALTLRDKNRDLLDGFFNVDPGFIHSRNSSTPSSLNRGNSRCGEVRSVYPREARPHDPKRSLVSFQQSDSGERSFNLLQNLQPQNKII